MALGTIHARHMDGRILATDTIISPTMRITTGVRINAEPAPPAPPGSFGVAWTGMAGDGSGRVPTQIDVDQVVRDIEGGLSLLTDAEQRAIRAKLTKFSGRQAAAPSAAGIATNDDALTMGQHETIKGMNDANKSFWDKRLKANAE